MRIHLLGFVILLLPSPLLADLPGAFVSDKYLYTYQESNSSVSRYPISLWNGSGGIQKWLGSSVNERPSNPLSGNTLGFPDIQGNTPPTITANPRIMGRLNTLTLGNSPDPITDWEEFCNWCGCCIVIPKTLSSSQFKAVITPIEGASIFKQINGVDILTGVKPAGDLSTQLRSAVTEITPGTDETTTNIARILASPKDFDGIATVSETDTND